ncbi:hypothetical protein L1987_22534 [Smallanthus sonchifolius]|uniref:Uncharacterized protein n=1 Tax=Smallanthus sonchifolius TaxID=185202 RepID=A0ACB9IG15_9ASTR|nr:hypothetical protein L1987_22534 [Smallanthus sonchifolius]
MYTHEDTSGTFSTGGNESLRCATNDRIGATIICNQEHGFYHKCNYRKICFHSCIMEANMLHDTHDVSTKNGTSGPVQPETSVSGDKKHQENKVDRHEHEHVGQDADDADMDSGDVNMEASISADDVIRAGGFGARDDISSFLPVASDSTDFEASLRNARGYEEPQKDICRPGLGWKEDVKEQD